MLSDLETIIGWKNFEDNGLIGRGCRLSPIWLSEEFFNPIISTLGRHITFPYLLYVATVLISGPGIFKFSCIATLPDHHSSKTFNHVLVLFNVFFFHNMTSLPFMFLFFQHGKLFAFFLLVSLAKIQRKVCQFLRKLWHFLKMDFEMQCDCLVIICLIVQLMISWIVSSETFTTATKQVSILFKKLDSLCPVNQIQQNKE